MLHFSDTVEQRYIDGKCIIGKWRRRDGFIYLSSELLEIFFEAKQDFSVSDLLAIGFSVQSVFGLIYEGFLEIIAIGSTPLLEASHEQRITFNYGNRFNQLKWYGYYDAD
jgi:hypothetical protein